MKYNVAVYLPLSLWLEIEAGNEDEAIAKAKAMALATPYEEWGDDFSNAEFEIVND